jgi:SAM-dependent methyltransferase
MTESDLSLKRTMRSYEDAADQYLAATPETLPTTMVSFIDQLAADVGTRGRTLELGTASGRDALAFEGRGVRVERSDATHAFVERLRESGYPARHLDLRCDPLGGPYDLIYANAVFLHFPPDELANVLVRTARALTPGGQLAFTVKAGDGSSWTDAKLGKPRHFHYWSENDLKHFLEVKGWLVIQCESKPSETGQVWLFVRCTATGALKTSSQSSASGRTCPPSL